MIMLDCAMLKYYSVRRRARRVFSPLWGHFYKNGHFFNKNPDFLGHMCPAELIEF
jgi:hypothetical protein